MNLEINGESFGSLDFRKLRRAIGAVKVYASPNPFEPGPVEQMVTAPLKQMMDGELADGQMFKAIVSEASSDCLNSGLPLTVANVSLQIMNRYSFGLFESVRVLFTSSQEEDALSGALLHDFYIGFSVTAASVQVADTRREFSEYADYETETTKRMAKHFADLLAKDETGYLVVDSQVEQFLLDQQFNRGFLIKPYYNSEFVIAGAQSARQYYKRIYPRVKELMSQNA